jgi:uridylate kinase
VVLCAAGTGNPYFTTDTAAALRALELNCDIMFKTTMVDGVYDKDPLKFPDALRFDTITYDEVLERQLKVMDLTAITLARGSNLPVLVLKLDGKGSIIKAALGETSIGTLITTG